MSFETHEVAIRLTANRSKVSLGKKLEHVTEIRLDEYAINTPGAVSTMWRLDFGQGIFSELTSNATGLGYPIVVDNATLTHVLYERPRVVSTQQFGEMNTINVNIVDGSGAAVTFTDMVLYLSFVCQVPEYNMEHVADEIWHHDVNPLENGGAAYTTGIYGNDIRPM